MKNAMWKKQQECKLGKNPKEGAEKKTCLLHLHCTAVRTHSFIGSGGKKGFVLVKMLWGGNRCWDLPSLADLCGWAGHCPSGTGGCQLKMIRNKKPTESAHHLSHQRQTPKILHDNSEGNLIPSTLQGWSSLLDSFPISCKQDCTPLVLAIIWLIYIFKLVQY